MRNINETINVYVNSIAPLTGVMQIYLFGSHAAGTAHEKSDIDLMVVVADNLKPDKMAIAVNKALVGSRTTPVDILVNTVSDFNEAATEPTIQNRIKNEGVLLYG
jgi:predicted nucleotidyltransferase